jgi:GT2 family glycosyltransferase
MGDDISFFKKAKEAGFKVYLAPDVKVGHQKSVIL